MSGEQIQVREGWWRQRCGDVVHVTAGSDRYYPWECRAFCYTDAGRIQSAKEREADLVEYLGEKIHVLREEPICGWWKDAQGGRLKVIGFNQHGLIVYQKQGDPEYYTTDSETWLLACRKAEEQVWNC